MQISVVLNTTPAAILVNLVTREGDSDVQAYQDLRVIAQVSTIVE